MVQRRVPWQGWMVSLRLYTTVRESPGDQYSVRRLVRLFLLKTCIFSFFLMYFSFILSCASPKHYGLRRRYLCILMYNNLLVWKLKLFEGKLWLWITNMWIRFFSSPLSCKLVLRSSFAVLNRQKLNYLDYSFICPLKQGLECISYWIYKETKDLVAVLEGWNFVWNGCMCWFVY